MKYNKVSRTTDISTIQNGNFVYCKELKKGFIKRDFSSLNLLEQKFEDVIVELEAMNEAILNSDFDRVIFGENMTEKQGQIIHSKKTQEQVKSEIVQYETSTGKENYLNDTWKKKPYFNNIEFEDMIITEIDTSIYQKITAPDASSSDLFGLSVCVNNSNLYVGGTNTESVYIFDLDGNYEKKITAPDPNIGEQFGASVCANNSNLYVGANRDNVGGTYTGSVYVFDLDGNYEKKITAPDASISDMFGISVFVNDSKLYVGAYFDDVGGTNTGSVYVFDLDGNYEKKITAPDASIDDLFGVSVCANASKLYVGAFADDVGGINSGSVYIFDLDGNYEKKIISPDVRSYDRFGKSIYADSSKLYVGAYQDSDADTGSVYVFDLDGNYEKKITAPDASYRDMFGVSVCVNDSKLYVGAIGDDDAGTDAGSVYIFGQ